MSGLREGSPQGQSGVPVCQDETPGEGIVKRGKHEVLHLHGHGALLVLDLRRSLPRCRKEELMETIQTCITSHGCSIMRVEEKLYTLRYKKDEEPHLKIRDPAQCLKCEQEYGTPQPCIAVCPRTSTVGMDTDWCCRTRTALSAVGAGLPVPSTTSPGVILDMVSGCPSGMVKSKFFN